MKRKIGWYGLVAGTLLLGWLVSPLSAQVKKFAYLSVAQTWTALQTFSSGMNITGGTTDFQFAGAISDPDAPTAAAGASTGGSCRSDTTYKFYVHYTNATGDTNLSAASGTVTPASGNTNVITVTRPSIGSNVNTWTAWFARSTDSYANIRGCSSSGNTATVDSGTETYSCLCAAIQNPVEPAANTTQDIYMLRIATSKSAVYYYRPATKIVEVCSVGCQYTTLTLALAGITDASATNRYIIFIKAPYQESTTSITLKSYISIVGESRLSVKLGELVFTATPAADVGVANLTLDKIHINNDGGGLTAYLDDLTFSGTASVAFDDSGGGYTVYANNCVFKSTAYVIGVGYTTKWYGSGNYYEHTGTGATQAACWWVSSIGAGLADDGGTLYERNPICILNNSSSAGTGNVTGLRINPASTDVSNVGTDVRLYNPTIVINTTNSSYAGRVGCYLVMDALANTSPSSINIYNGDCRVTAAGSSAAVVGLGVDLDTDHANYSVYLDGGKIALSGGASRYDINNAETTAGFTLDVNGTMTGGSYTGSGQIYGTALHAGGKSYSFPIATAPAACSIGDFYVDTSGAFCACTSANTWTNTSAVGTCA